MSARPLSALEHDALFRVLRASSPNVVLRAMVTYYDGLAAVQTERKQPELAAECRVVRDGLEATWTALSETERENAKRITELFDQLTASLAAARAARQPKVA